MYFRDFSRVLAAAIGQPDLENTEVLLRRDRDPVNFALDGMLRCQGLANERIAEILPCRHDLSSGHPVREATAGAVPGIFPRGLDPLSHQEEHTVLNKLVGEDLCYGNGRFYSIKR